MPGQQKIIEGHVIERSSQWQCRPGNVAIPKTVRGNNHLVQRQQNHIAIQDDLYQLCLHAASCIRIHCDATNRQIHVLHLLRTWCCRRLLPSPLNHLRCCKDLYLIGIFIGLRIDGCHARASAVLDIHRGFNMPGKGCSDLCAYLHTGFAKETPSSVYSISGMSDINFRHQNIRYHACTIPGRHMRQQDSLLHETNNKQQGVKAAPDHSCGHLPYQ